MKKRPDLTTEVREKIVKEYTAGVKTAVIQLDHKISPGELYRIVHKAEAKPRKVVKEIMEFTEMRPGGKKRGEVVSMFQSSYLTTEEVILTDSMTLMTIIHRTKDKPVEVVLRNNKTGQHQTIKKFQFDEVVLALRTAHALDGITEAQIPDEEIRRWCKDWVLRNKELPGEGPLTLGPEKLLRWCYPVKKLLMLGVEKLNKTVVRCKGWKTCSYTATDCHHRHKHWREDTDCDTGCDIIHAENMPCVPVPIKEATTWVLAGEK